jgi:hypothetical protein
LQNVPFAKKAPAAGNKKKTRAVDPLNILTLKKGAVSRDQREGRREQRGESRE